MDHGGDDVATKTPNQPTEEEGLAELNSLVRRAKSGDRTAVPRLRQYLDLNPPLWHHAGDVGLQAQAAWIDLICGQNLHMRECLVRRLNEMKQGLVGDTKPSPLEVLLIERIAVAWLQVSYLDAHAVQCNEMSIRWAEFQLKRQAQAEKQYRSVIDALQTCRRVLRPISVEIHQAPAASPPAPIIAGTANGDQPAVDDVQPVSAPTKRTNGFSVPVNRITSVNGHNRVSELLAPVGAGADG
jgi:hypothetical protein